MEQLSEAQSGALLSDEVGEPVDEAATEASAGAQTFVGSRRGRLAALALGVTFCGLCGIAARQFPSRHVTSGSEVLLSQKWDVVGSDRFCGITNNPHLCPEMLAELYGVHPDGAFDILCKAVSLLGGNDCELDMVLREWEHRDPTLCTPNGEPKLMFLWTVLDSMDADPSGGLEPDPLCGGPGLDDCVEWAAKVWMEYVDKWRPKLIMARKNGLHVTSPKFAGDVLSKMNRFFTACPECSTVGSPYYIDALAFNAWIDPNRMAIDAAHIKDIARQLKATYSNRPVILNNLATNTAFAAQDADIITNSGLFEKANNPLDAVYWNVYPKPYSPSERRRNCLLDQVQSGPMAGKYVGGVLVEKCAQNQR